MSKRFWVAAAVSAAVHIGLVVVLRGGAAPLPLDTPQAVELEMVYEPRATPAEVERPPEKSAARAPKGLLPASAKTGNRTAAPSPAPSVPVMAEGPAEVVDRLSTLRVPARAPMPGIWLPNEEPNAFRANPMPKVIKAVPADPKVVQGRGGVKMFLADDGEIKQFANPEPHAEGLGFVFDLTDEVMKKLGTNPYRYEQHRLAEATREERFCRRLKVQAQNEREALFSLPAELAALWADTSLTPAERRKLLFERWDECREDNPNASASGATAMRTAIESFIRTNLPDGSPLAYPPHELAGLNEHRSSSATFAPYARPASSAPVPDAGGG